MDKIKLLKISDFDEDEQKIFKEAIENYEENVEELKTKINKPYRFNPKNKIFISGCVAEVLVGFPLVMGDVISFWQYALIVGGFHCSWAFLFCVEYCNSRKYEEKAKKMYEEALELFKA